MENGFERAGRRRRQRPTSVRLSAGQCFATGNVTGVRLPSSSPASYIGGLIGYHGGYQGVAANCYATGRVFGDRYVGGLFGRGEQVVNCYAANPVEVDPLYQETAGPVIAEGSHHEGPFKRTDRSPADDPAPRPRSPDPASFR